MEKLINVKEIFSGTIARAEELEKELQRLSEIEEKLERSLKVQKDKVTSLEKTLGYSSICSEVKAYLEKLCNDSKKEANAIGYTLGLDTQYNVK
jgi:hypothetical protein